MKAVQVGYRGGLPMKERKELRFGINIEVTTEIKKKGVLAYQGVPQRKTRADYSFRKRGGASSWSQLILCKVQSSALGQRLILLFHSHRKKKNPMAYNKLDFGMQKSPFYTLQGLGSLRLLPAGLAGVDSRRAVRSWLWENGAVAGIAAEPQRQFKMWWGQLPFNRHR